MLKQRQEILPLYRPIITKSKYNEEIETPTFIKNISIVIGLNGYNNYTNNSINVINCDFIGFTKETGVQKGDIIDNKYIVEYVVINRRGLFAYLKEINSNENTNR